MRLLGNLKLQMNLSVCVCDTALLQRGSSAWKDSYGVSQLRGFSAHPPSPWSAALAVGSLAVGMFRGHGSGLLILAWFREHSQKWGSPHESLRYYSRSHCHRSCSESFPSVPSAILWTPNSLYYIPYPFLFKILSMFAFPCTEPGLTKKNQNSLDSRNNFRNETPIFFLSFWGKKKINSDDKPGKVMRISLVCDVEGNVSILLVWI